jgi:hypothetical protein
MIFCIFSCSKESKEQKEINSLFGDIDYEAFDSSFNQFRNSSFTNYITKGNITPKQAIHVRFEDNIVSADMIDKTDKRIKVKVQPKVKGQIKWIDRQEFKFIPDKEWKQRKKIQNPIRYFKIGKFERKTSTNYYRSSR